MKDTKSMGTNFQKRAKALTQPFFVYCPSRFEPHGAVWTREYPPAMAVTHSRRVLLPT